MDTLLTRVTVSGREISHAKPRGARGNGQQEKAVGKIGKRKG